MMRSLELRRQRAKLIEDAGKLLTLAHDEDREVTSEEEERFDKMHADADVLLKQIEREELQEARSRELTETLAEPTVESRVGPSNDPAENANAQRDTFRSWMRYGPDGLTEEQHAIAAKRMVSMSNLPPEIQARAAQTVTTTGGGYMIAREFQAELDQAMLAYGGMRQAARIVTTSTGATMDWPTVNDTGNTGRLLGINTTVTNTAIAYGTVPFEAYKFSSDSVLIPVELAQDSAFDIDAHVNSVLAERLGRVTNTYLTTGSGSSQPKGVVTAATDSAVDFDISAGPTLANFVDLEHTVDPAYRPGSRFMFHDDMLALAKKLVDSNGRPIFRPATETPGGIDTLLGYPITINQDVPDPGTATNKAVLFGNFQKYIVRVVRPMVMVRLVERYADDHQIGFLAFERLDGDLVDAGTNPIKYADMIA